MNIADRKRCQYKYPSQNYNEWPVYGMLCVNSIVLCTPIILWVFKITLGFFVLYNILLN